MKRSLKLLTSGIPGDTLPTSLGFSFGQEPKNQHSALKRKVIDRAKEALAGVEGLSKPKRMAIVILITQALDTTTDAEILQMMATVRAEFDAVISEFGSGQ